MINLELTKLYEFRGIGYLSNILIYGNEANIPLIFIFKHNSSYERCSIHYDSDDWIHFEIDEVLIGEKVYSKDSTIFKRIKDEYTYKDEIITHIEKFVRPLLYSKVKIGDFWFQYNDDSFGTNVYHFLDESQELGFITYLREWIHFNPKQLEGRDYYKESKELDNYLSRERLNTGYKLRVFGTNNHVIRREDAGEIDSRLLNGHLMEILSLDNLMTAAI